MRAAVMDRRNIAELPVMEATGPQGVLREVVEDGIRFTVTGATGQALIRWSPIPWENRKDQTKIRVLRPMVLDLSGAWDLLILRLANWSGMSSSLIPITSAGIWTCATFAKASVYPTVRSNTLPVGSWIIVRPAIVEAVGY